jgi:hypothetical protein
LEQTGAVAKPQDATSLSSGLNLVNNGSGFIDDSANAVNTMENGFSVVSDDCNGTTETDVPLFSQMSQMSQWSEFSCTSNLDEIISFLEKQDTNESQR